MQKVMLLYKTSYYGSKGTPGPVFELNECRLVSNLFSLYFVYLQYLLISRFGFKSGIYLLIAPVPDHCFSITFNFKIRHLIIFQNI